MIPNRTGHEFRRIAGTDLKIQARISLRQEGVQRRAVKPGEPPIDQGRLPGIGRWADSDAGKVLLIRGNTRQLLGIDRMAGLEHLRQLRVWLQASPDAEPRPGVD